MKTNVSRSLDFRKSSVTELSEKQQNEVIGGASTAACYLSGVLVATVIEKLHISVYDM